MDTKLPRLLEIHLNSLLQEYTVANWNLKCGENSTLTIFFKSTDHKDSLQAEDNFGTHSIYRKKPPSQIRRDQRRSKSWRMGNLSHDSGYKASPSIVSNKTVFHGNQLDVQGYDISTPEISNVQYKGPYNLSPAIVGEQDNVCLHTLDSKGPKLAQISPPRDDIIHIGKAHITTGDFITESMQDIPELELQHAVPTFEEPSAVRFTNVTVKDKETDGLPSKKYINVKRVPTDDCIDVASLYYCKRCHLDLKQQSYAYECPLSCNLCTECCAMSNESCYFCPKHVPNNPYIRIT